MWAQRAVRSCQRGGVLQRGQVLVLALVLLFAGVLGLMLLFNAGQVLTTKQRLTHAADAAAYSAALWRARVLNFDAYANRAIVLQEVAIAQAVTLVSWAKYYQTFTRNVGRIVSSVFPPAAAIVAIADEIIDAARVATEQAAAFEVAARGTEGVGYKNLLAASQEILHASAGTFGASAVANEVARASDRRFFAFALSDDGEFERLTKRYASDEERGRLRGLVMDSLDDFVSGPRGADLMLPVPSGCAGGSPRPEEWVQWLRKRGGTVMAPDLERWEAADVISIQDYQRARRFSLRCGEVEVMPLGWGAAEASDDGEEGRLLADPGNVSRNRTATSNAEDEMNGDSQWGLSRYSGITRVRELDFDQLENTRFPTSRVAVLARVDGEDVRTAGVLPAGTGRLALRDDFAGGRLWALSVAEVYFRRPPVEPLREEYASLYSPYWQVRLAAPQAEDRARASSYAH